MIEMRAFHRVPHAAKVVLTGGDGTFNGKLKNISFGGAMVNIKDEHFFQDKSKYLLEIFGDDDISPLMIYSEVAYKSSSVLGLQFLEVDNETHSRINMLISNIETSIYFSNTFQ